MKDKSTLVKYTREEQERVPDETDWKKVDTMTDEEVYQDACNDRDAQPTDETFWETAPLPAHGKIHTPLKPNVHETSIVQTLVKNRQDLRSPFAGEV